MASTNHRPDLYGVVVTKIVDSGQCPKRVIERAHNGTRRPKIGSVSTSLRVSSLSLPRAIPTTTILAERISFVLIIDSNMFHLLYDVLSITWPRAVDGLTIPGSRSETSADGCFTNSDRGVPFPLISSPIDSLIAVILDGMSGGAIPIAQKSFGVLVK